MARKSKRSDWTPNPDCEAAFARVIDIAHICAASLFGEKPTDDPDKNASPQALMHAMGMVYFLLRIDSKDLAALSTGPGSFADWTYKPFPPGYWRKTAIFEDFAWAADSGEDAAGRRPGSTPAEMLAVDRAASTARQPVTPP